MNTNVEKKTIIKQLGLFLIITLPVTWILMGVSLHTGKGDAMSTPLGNLLYMIACFMPAIAGVVVCVFMKERIRTLNLLPKLQGNTKVYLLAIISAVVISIIDPLVMALFFPKVGRFSAEVSGVVIIFTVIQYVAIGCLQFFMLMGEEIGWMGFLFPRLEKMCGTTLGIVLTGVVRGLWHVVLFLQDGKFMWQDFGMLIFTNIVGGCMLIMLTKMSKSVVPAAVFHSLTNSIPSVLLAFMTVDPVAYEEQEMIVTLAGYIPYVIIMAICYIVIIKRYRTK